MQPLSDGIYDVLVIDVHEDDENIATSHLEVVIASGAHKGEVVRVRAERLSHDSMTLLGVPATLTVSDGQPRLSFE
jgi:hypothetical protein